MSLYSKLLRTQSRPVEGIPSIESVAGDVCMYGISEGKLIIVNDWDASKYPISKYPPIGIVAVPGSHNHYADGKCAVVSLNYMNKSTPSSGGEFQQMSTNSEVSSLYDFSQSVYVGKDGSVGANVLGQNSYAYLPSDSNNFSALNNPYDTNTKYKLTISGMYYAPSPYNNDGTFNTNYSLIASPSSTSNCLSDFDGYNNTKKTIEVRGTKDYSTWKPTNDYQDYAPASCCDMYFTQGTKQGNWYLPAAGEMGYVVVRQLLINNTINKLINGGVSWANAIKEEHHWTSTPYIKSKGSRGINFSNGGLYDYNFEFSYVSAVRAFLQV